MKCYYYPVDRVHPVKATDTHSANRSCGTSTLSTGFREDLSWMLAGIAKIGYARVADGLQCFGFMSDHPPGGVRMSDSSALDCSVLVLNRFYMAVRVIDVRRAMTLLYRGCAEVIVIEDDQYANYDFENWCELSDIHALEKQKGEDFIRTPTRELQVPRIVRLVLYDRVPKSTVRFNRKTLFARDGYRCQYCAQTRPMSQLSLDHVVPRSQGGRTTWENVVCSCTSCNSKKGGRTPAQASMKLLTTPIRPHTNPGMAITLNDPRYVSWKTFLPSAVGN